MLIFLSSFAITVVLTWCILVWGRSRSLGFADSTPRGPQAFHVRAAPRLGGLAIFLALAGVVGIAWQAEVSEFVRLTSLLLACSLPAFVSGLAEDLTEKVQPSRRFVATTVAALLAVLLLDASVRRTDLYGLDWVASFGFGAALLSVFAVTGIVNAVNIIDGFNGLASMCSIMMLLALGVVAHLTGDTTLTLLTLAVAGTVLGFFVWNFPGGLIFLGDGGAYLLGFLIAEIGILLLHRNPEVSPLCPLLIVIYPVFETVFSMYRRRWLQGRSVGAPDGVHLHSLVYRRVMRGVVDGEDDRAAALRNSMTAPYLWLLCLLAIVPAVVFRNDSRVIGGFILLFGLSYVALYWSIVRFRTPRVLVIRRP